MQILSVLASALILCQIYASFTINPNMVIAGPSRSEKSNGAADLETAIQKGDDLQTFLSLIRSTHQLSVFNRDQLVDAVESQSVDIVNEMLESEATGGCQFTLETAAKIGNLEILDMLLQDGRFQQFLPAAFIAAAGNPEPAVLAHLFANHFHKFSLQVEYSLLESMIIEFSEDDLVANARLILRSVPPKDLISISALTILDYCEEAEAWKVLGALMAARHSDPIDVDSDDDGHDNLEDDIPNLLLGLNRLLISHADANYDGDLHDLDPQARLDTVYSLGQDSEAVNDYLESFWETYERLAEDLKCRDWLMEWNMEHGLSKHQIMAIGKAISIPLSGVCTRSELLQAARDAINL